MALQIDAGTNPALLKAVKAALAQERGASLSADAAPLDPNHSPFGHVRLATTGGGWICGACGKTVIDQGIGEWRHR